MLNAVEYGHRHAQELMRSIGAAKAAASPTVAPDPAARRPATESASHSLMRDMAETPPVNIAKVERLKAEIAAGTYRIDPGRIADAMIADEGIALGKTR